MTTLYSDRKYIGQMVLSTFTVSSNSTVTNGTDFDSVNASVFFAKYALFTPTFKSTSGATGDVDFHFIAIGNEAQEGAWPTVASFVVTATCNGSNTVIGPATAKDMQGYYRIKLLKVVNKDTTHPISYVGIDVATKF